MPRALVKLLILFLVSMVVFFMLMYKFKYDQMKLIVEGAGLDAVDRYLHKAHIVSSFPQLRSVQGAFEGPMNTYVNLTDFWLFSAFACGDDMSEFCAVGFGPDRAPDFDCSVWFDLGRDLVSVAGSFSFTKTEIDSSSAAYEFKCSLDDLKPIHRKPYILDVKTTDRSRKIFIPVYRTQRVNGKNRYALCLYPDRAGNEWKSLMEFLSYHEIIGFTDIIAYDNGINHGFFDKLKTLVVPSNGTLQSLSVIRWTMPVDNLSLEKHLIDVDCTRRTAKSTELTVALRWNQYLSLRDGGKVDSLLKSISSAEPFAARLPAQRCCTDTMDDRRSEKNFPIVLRKTLCIPDDEKQQLFLYKPSSNALPISSANLNAELLVYAKCHGLPLSDLAPVFSMWKYATLIRKSTLLRQWNENGVFSI
ncbi:DNA polymerase [Nesidiocoris tenuis]|uniref:DNA polymerase n=1 Tax=Nesidiocoris tenuis TaxID=355587 RepID=A0ABN7AFX0_9HEMI|nr:DNA polymerase [Nesidiocoris tenuis]